VPINDNYEEEIKRLKTELEKKGYSNVSWTELMAILLEKNRRMTLSDKEVENIMKKMRGIF
jgi:uncharacterized protein (DUF302 family)